MDNHFVKNPHFFLAPIWAGIVLNKFLDKSNPIDVGGLFEAQLDVIFSSKRR